LTKWRGGSLRGGWDRRIVSKAVSGGGGGNVRKGGKGWRKQVSYFNEDHTLSRGKKTPLQTEKESRKDKENISRATTSKDCSAKAKKVVNVCVFNRGKEGRGIRRVEPEEPSVCRGGFVLERGKFPIADHHALKGGEGTVANVDK